MALPLYEGLQPLLPSGTDLPKRHWGLYSDRYFDAHPEGFNDTSAQNAELQKDRDTWFRVLHGKPVGEADMLASKARSIRNMAVSMGGQARLMRSEGLFVTGLGNPHPMENGFTWHPTLGTPYLPGSAVKGLTRALVETAYEGNDRNEVLKRWFGTAEKGDVAEQSGQFIFLDALPTEPCQLHVAIMTPHMGKWYEKGGKDASKAESQPGDWHAPVPVRYLAARNVLLQFAILPRTPAAKAELDDVWYVLDTALNQLGAGAKTAIGFGMFTQDDSAEKRLHDAVAEQLQAQAKESAKANASPVGQLLMTLEEVLPRDLRLPRDGNKLGEALKQIDALVDQLLGFADISAEDKDKAHARINQAIPAKLPGLSGNQDKARKALLRKLKPLA